MLQTKDFNGAEFHAFCQQQYDEARRFLKRCGKPKDEVDRFLIEKHKTDASVFGKMLDMAEAVKLLELKECARKERESLKNKLLLIDAFLSA